jgi:glycosyltransferase involved in cell wall biosynthesis
MLADGFPPAPRVTIRALKFAKYLPEYGWAPLVVCPREHSNAGLASVFLDLPAGVVVRRTWCAPAPSRMASRLVRLLGQHHVSAGKSGSGTAAAPAAYAPLMRGLRQLLLWAETPDILAGWIPIAVLAARRLVRERRAEAIYATGPHFSVIVAGALAARLTGLPLVADFRDTWTLDESDPFGTLGGSFQSTVSERRIRTLRRLERWALRRSTAVLFTSRASETRYLAEYPEIAGRTHVIYNGADPSDFRTDVSPLKRPTIAHVGTVHDYQWPQVARFLAEFDKALKAGMIPSDVEVVFAGVIGARLREQFDALVDDLGLPASSRLVGFLPRSEAIALMRTSRLLLLFSGDNPYIRLSKLSEYLATGRPILFFGRHDTEAAKEVTEAGGWVARSASDPAVASALAMVNTDAPDTCLRSILFDGSHPLDRRTEAKQLATILDGLLASDRH